MDLLLSYYYYDVWGKFINYIIYTSMMPRHIKIMSALEEETVTTD